MRYLTCVPAYGRDYTSAKAVKSDWNAGKDFKICDLFSGEDGRMINKQDGREGEVYNIRYKRLTQICVIKGGGR